MPKATKSHPGQPESRATRKPNAAAGRQVDHQTTRQPQSEPARDTLGGIVRQAATDPASLGAPALQRLQHTIGNRALARLTPPRKGPMVQPKLQVGPAGDQYEQEADRMAARVVAMPAPAAPAAPGEGPVQ